VVAAGEVGAADAAGEQHVADEGALRASGAVEHHVARRVAGAVAHVEHAVADLHRVAVGSQRVGVKGSACGKPNMQALLASAVDPELVARVRADDRQAVLARQLPVPPAWSMWAWVSQICFSVRPSGATAASMRGRSPPGSMTAASCVRSHQTMEQFCWKGVTGTVW
jgi:hypothetical protein